jgi:multimeric flavodoxin WrbA
VNILAIGSSARRNGNSNSLMRLALESAEASGATADVLYSPDLSVQGCLGCDGCKQSHDATCVVKDDVHEVYARLMACDALVLASPVYFYTMSSWLKVIIDRLYALIDLDGASRLTRGKAFYVITAEEEERTFAGQDIVTTLCRALAWLNMDLQGALVATGLRGRQDWQQREDLIRAAQRLISVV